jgi:hypothetical protein
VWQGATIRTALTVPNLRYTYLHVLCCIILPLISLGFPPPPPPTSLLAWTYQDLIQLLMTIYTHLTLTLLYPVILCNLTLERIRHKLLTRVGSFVETRATLLSSTFFLSYMVCLQSHISFNDTTRIVRLFYSINEEMTLIESI